MGLGDELMGAGIARGAAARGERIAFGDGQRVMWHGHAHEIFRGNPNVLRPGQERSFKGIRWVKHYPGERLYNVFDQHKRKWVFYKEFRPTPGEIFLDGHERKWAAEIRRFDVLIEPNVKGMAPNKQWPVERYQEVADRLIADGLMVAQIVTGTNRLERIPTVTAPSFRHAIALLECSTLYIGPEGGLHHAMAAVAGKAVVIFGGFIHPRTTGYDTHINLFHGDEPCGRVDPCDHCARSMKQISPEQVLSAARDFLHETGSRVLATG